MKTLSGHSGTLSREVSRRELDHRAIARRIAAEGIVLLETTASCRSRKALPWAFTVQRPGT